MKINPVKIVPIISATLRIWYKTLRYQQVGLEEIESFRQREQGRAVLFALWHDELFAPIFLHKNQDVTILVSESRDGEFITRILEGFGYNTIRGSSTRGGVKALKNLVKLFDMSPRDMAIAIDGPLGPRHEVKHGVIYLAWKLKIPIVPVRSFLSFKKVFSRSWDTFQLPLPGSKCRVVYGKPYFLNYKKLSGEILKKEAYVLKNKMKNLENL